MKRSVWFRPLLMMGVLLLAILACTPGGAPPVASGTDATMAALQSMATAASVELTRVAGQNAPPPVEQPPTEVSGPTAEPPTVAPAAGQQYFTDEFDTDSGNWKQDLVKNSDSGDLSEAKVNIENGRLAFNLGKNLIAYMIYQPFEYEDVRVDARVENRGTNVNDILLVCRESSEGHYLVNIANSGLFSMYAYDGGNQSYARIADGGSKKIKSGKEVNDYALVCKGRDITLYINGSKVRTYTDNRFAFRSGKIGVGVASEDQIPVAVEFDFVKVSQP